MRTGGSESISEAVRDEFGNVELDTQLFEQMLTWAKDAVSKLINMTEVESAHACAVVQHLQEAAKADPESEISELLQIARETFSRRERAAAEAVAALVEEARKEGLGRELDYNEIIEAIRSVSSTRIPGLLMECVRQGYAHGVFLPSGASKMVQNRERTYGFNRELEPILTMFRTTDGRYLCNECFNALPAAARDGCLAQALRWVPGNTPRAACSECQREAVVCDESQRVLD